LQKAPNRRKINANIHVGGVKDPKCDLISFEPFFFFFFFFLLFLQRASNPKQKRPIYVPRKFTDSEKPKKRDRKKNQHGFHNKEAKGETTCKSRNRALFFFFFFFFLSCTGYCLRSSGMKHSPKNPQEPLSAPFAFSSHDTRIPNSLQQQPGAWVASEY
jgi:hypothetical protein